MKEIKNDLEELDVMQGIDFKTNQRKVREQEKEKFKKIIRNILLAVLLIGLIVLLKIQKDSAIDSCIKNGRSYNYCVNHI